MTRLTTQELDETLKDTDTELTFMFGSSKIPRDAEAKGVGIGNTDIEICSDLDESDEKVTAIFKA